MKVLTLLLLSLVALFMGHKQEMIPKNINQTMKISPSSLGLASANSKCHAKQVNPSDGQAYLPDPQCTPGVLNTAVTQATISQTICVPGYTKTIRPPASYTDQLKIQQIQQYGYIDTTPKNYEEDHLISLELGGNPTDPQNLWPEPHQSTNEKDMVENYLHKQICSGAMTLSDAHYKIVKNWYTIYLQIK